MANWHLAQLNIAHMIDTIDSPTMVGFVSELDRINALAESSPGFVWRLINDVRADNTDEPAFGDDVIVNLSVWESVELLHQFTYRTAHTEVMSRKKLWFQRMTSAHMVLWWVPAGHHPSELEARDRLAHLEAHGPSEHAFTFKRASPMPAQ